ncbi:hypothetical protein BJX99DRAFT_247759 [Aspergillus californicus]
MEVKPASHSSGDHNPNQACLPGDPAIRQNIKLIAKTLGARGSTILAWGKDHLPKRILNEQYRLSLNDDDLLPSNVHEPGIPPSEIPTEQPSSRIHLSRSNDRLNACDCPSPEQGPLCMASSVTTTITGGGYVAAAEKTNLSSRILEWVYGLEKHAMTMIHDPYALYVSTFTTSGSNTLPSDLNLTGGAACDRLMTTTSSLEQTVMTIQYSTTTIEDELVPGAINIKTSSRRSTISQPSDGSISERASQDRIRMLETRRDALTRRRASLEKAIYDLTWHSQPCFGAYDMISREEVKKLTSKLVDIKREEHNVGLNIFRSLRSQDEDRCGGGCSSLWVSRVTR